MTNSNCAAKASMIRIPYFPMAYSRLRNQKNVPMCKALQREKKYFSTCGGSRFHYPSFISTQAYNYTTFVGGGGVDYRLSSRITVRPADFEYQHWQFPPTGLTPWVFSAGASYRLF
ncbi:MAG: hypothetical protein ACYCOX_18790 [Acidobacteriaceae bacterium]